MTNSYDDVTLGEIGRSMMRIETAMGRMTVQMQEVSGYVAGLQSRMSSAEKTISELETCLKDVQRKAFFLSGAISGGVALVNFIFRSH